MRKFINIITEAMTIPVTLRNIAHEIEGLSWDDAKRVIVSKTGSVDEDEEFDDELADIIFLRVQRNSQIGQYADEADIEKLGRNARRLDGDDTLTVYRAAPKGGGIRPGDFCTPSEHEAGYYMHGNHVIQHMDVPRHDLIAVDGSLGDGQELIYLPIGYRPDEPHIFFDSFREFYDAAQSDL